MIVRAILKLIFGRPIPTQSDEAIRRAEEAVNNRDRRLAWLLRKAEHSK